MRSWRPESRRCPAHSSTAPSGSATVSASCRWKVGRHDRGEPSDLTRRRWQRFGASGAELVWGGEAVAVRQRPANPNQLLMFERNEPSLAALRDKLVNAHRERFGANADSDLFGLQLTHSGRFSRPNIGMVRAARRARQSGPRQAVPRRRPADDRRPIDRRVDEVVEARVAPTRSDSSSSNIEHCHGFSGPNAAAGRARAPWAARRQPGNPTRFLAPSPTASTPSCLASASASAVGHRQRLIEKLWTGLAGQSRRLSNLQDGLVDGRARHRPRVAIIVIERRAQLLRLLQSRRIRWFCLTHRQPLILPHVVRPQLFPPADGYEPPDPLRGVARQIAVTARLKPSFRRWCSSARPTRLSGVASEVGQSTLRHGMTDFVGLGRMMLSIPSSRRTCSRADRSCASTSAGPRRSGRPSAARLVSGCYPLDPLYVAHPHAPILKEAKRRPGHEPTVQMTSVPQIVAVLTASLALCRRRLRLRPAAVLSVLRAGAGWTRQQVTSGTLQQDLRRAGGRVSRRPSRRSLRPASLLLGGIVMAGGALSGCRM